MFYFDGNSSEECEAFLCMKRGAFDTAKSVAVTNAYKSCAIHTLDNNLNCCEYQVPEEIILTFEGCFPNGEQEVY